MVNENNIPRTALVACSRLVDFAGSEITALEIAQALRNLGVEVEMAALEIGAPMEGEIKLLDIKYIDLSKISISGRAFDFLWVNHYVTAYHLLVKEGIRAKTAVFSSLSHFEPIETPPLPFFSFSRYTVNSEESLSHFKINYPNFKDKVGVFPNAAPFEFFDAYRKSLVGRIKSIAIISNHPPSEIIDLIVHFRKEGIEVDLIGIHGKNLRVTPCILSNYSAVITIGKTVQYCLAIGIPVFCYDHFGGPGWITLESFELAFAKNFSGRCAPSRRVSGCIALEISSGFKAALNQREALQGLAKTHFDIAKNLLSVLDAACQVPFLISLSETENHVLSRESSVFLNQRQVIANNHYLLAERDNQITDLNHFLAERDNQITDLNHFLAERDNQITDLNHFLAERDDTLFWSRKELLNVLMSTSWKLTYPMRQLKTNWGILKVRLRILLERAIFILGQGGLLCFFRRAIFFVWRYGKNKLAAIKFKRLVANAWTLVPHQGEPLVSFVIPIYDRTDILRTSIESALEQSQQVFEVILITDGSPPETLAVVEEFCSDPRVRIFSYPVSSGNAVRGRNKGILEARGRYIAFLDSDDVSAPNRLEVCLPILEAGKADVVYGAWRVKLDGTREIDGLAHGQEVHSPDCDLAMLEKNCVPCQSTVMVRREILQRTGFLKPRMQYREDHELWVRLANHGAIFKSVPYVLTDLRLHSGNNELNFKGNDAHWETLLHEEYHRPGPIPKKIAFLLAGLGISGGANVVLKHVSMLMAAGHDAFVIDLGGCGDISWFGNPAIPVYRLEQMRRCDVENIDLLFATFWTTVAWLEKIPARRKLYFVQSDERLFYKDDSVIAQVADTYRRDYEYVTIAEWLVEMLRKDFGKLATYVRNGLDTELFYPDPPLGGGRRLRVLIEGPISVPFKGVSDAYEAIKELDCDIWIVSSDGRPELNWKYDLFFQAINQSEMRRIYSSCDILLKMSKVESFAYPPLEAMACGCAVVLGDVSGGIEYASDGVNVLKVPKGDIVSARVAVQKLLDDSVLRERLIKCGLETTKCWSWELSRVAMLGLVELNAR
jgi:glycosyltransferase involved in cell wall biosynthesis